MAGLALALTYLYKVKITGEIDLGDAPGKATITRESDTGFAHIVGKDMESVVYA
jgi:hypothetical protein